MTTENAPENAGSEVTDQEIEKATAEIEKQEVKVDNASTPAEAEKEGAKLDKLIAGFDALIERMGKVETRLAEPTVPAPAAKETSVVETPKVEETPQGEPQTVAKRRRLGAWGG